MVTAVTQGSRAGAQSRKLEAGTGIETWRNSVCRPAPHSLFRLLSYVTQDHLPRNSTTHSGVGLLTSITNQEDALQANPSSQVTLAHIKVTETDQHSGDSYQSFPD